MSEIQAKIKLLEKLEHNKKRDLPEKKVGVFELNDFLALLDEGIKSICEKLDTLDESLANKDIKEDIRNINSEHLDKLSEIQPALVEITQSIKNIDIPDRVKLDGINKVDEINKSINLLNERIAEYQEKGVIHKVVVQDWRKEYMYSDSDKTGSTIYAGFIHKTGKWFIERITKSGETSKARYVFGKKDYAQNWGNKSALNYQYLHEAYDG